MIFFIDVLTWCGQQKALKAFLYWCYVSFIEKECQWLYRECKPLPYQGKLLLQGKVLLGLEFYWAYLPILWLICFMQLLEVSILSGSCTFGWHASFGLFACLDFGLCCLFLFLSLSWVLSFIEIW
jgi:hypothetical protein